MIKLPALIVFFLPKKYQEQQIQMRWDECSDSEVMEAYNDDVKWIDCLDNLYGDEESALRDKFKSHLSNYVIPQINKRNLETK